MEFLKQESKLGLNILLKEEDKFISICFMSNGDLYFSLHSKGDNRDNKFVITKENYNIYKLFEKLFIDIENINSYEKGDSFFTSKTDDKIKYDKNKYSVLNCSSNNKLLNKNKDTVTWYSDETAYSIANFLKIKKGEDGFELEFHTQPSMDKNNAGLHSSNYIPIRYRKCGDKYDPLNIVFTKMHNNFKKIDDVYDYGHQISMEEYMYNKVKKLSK